MSPLDGVHLWLWNLDQADGGNYDAIAARVKGVGARGVIVKAADGTTWFPQHQAGSARVVPVTEIVSELRARGLTVGTWSYCYGGAGYTEERNRAAETITEAQPDFHVLDIEQEWENQPNAAAEASTFMASLRAGIPAGFPVAYSPLPVIGFHLKLPYRQFSDAGCPMLPQLYWTGLQYTVDATLAAFYAPAEQYHLRDQPIYPAYQDTPGAETTDADIAAFAQAIRLRGATGVSVWEYGQLTPAGWTRLQALAQQFQPSDSPTQLAAVTAERDALRTQRDQLATGIRTLAATLPAA